MSKFSSWLKARTGLPEVHLLPVGVDPEAVAKAFANSVLDKERPIVIDAIASFMRTFDAYAGGDEDNLKAELITHIEALHLNEALTALVDHWIDDFDLTAITGGPKDLLDALAADLTEKVQTVRF